MKLMRKRKLNILIILYKIISKNVDKFLYLQNINYRSAVNSGLYTPVTEFLILSYTWNITRHNMYTMYSETVYYFYYLNVSFSFFNEHTHTHTRNV